MNNTIKEQIRVKNIGPIKDTNTIDIKPLTVLIGASACGKSTLMKIIILMRYIYKLVNIKAYLKNSDIDDDIFDIRFKDFLKDGVKSLISYASEIEYSVEINERKYLIEYKNGRLSTPKNIPNEDLTFVKEVWISEMRNVIPVWASHGSLVKGSSFGFYFDETFKDFNEATDYIKDVDLGHLNMRLEVVKGGNNQKKFIVTPNNESYSSFELKYASSGTLTTAPLITLLKYFSTAFSFKEAMRRSIIMMLFEKNLTEKYHPTIELGNLPKYVHTHVEEPELSLDPRSQRELINTMIKYVFHQPTDRSMGLVLATHSPYIINHLNVLIRSSYADTNNFPSIKPEDIAAYKISDGHLIDLMAIDEESNQLVINTFDLSEIMEDIYNDYESLA